MDPLSTADRQALLRLAREAIAADLGGLVLALPAGSLARPAGAFVTLHCGRQLRGCIGHVEANLPLAQVVVQCAISARKADPRFAPVAQTELAALQIEISVLGALEPID